jgi:hypothetical protein
MRNTVKRNFILQQGFEEPGAAACPLQYSSLMFQPRVVLVWVVTGIVFQSPLVFGFLCAFLWWSALFPKVSPFDALYNATFASRPGTPRLGPAPAPRRFSQAMAGAFALTIALFIYAGFNFAAYVFQAVFMVEVLALAIGGFCLGSFIYHLLAGRARFARQTLPWAD